MERYKNFVRIEQMKEHIRSGRVDRALELADQLEPATIRSSSDLNIMADLYLESGMLAKAGECLGALYERKKTRSVLMQLINLSIRLKQAREAEKYYREFKALAPGDFYNYIFRYNIDKIEGKPYETLIASLEKLKSVEYIESWAYELAKLYHKAGDREKCINECNDIEVWFGEGDYVDRARALKAYYAGDLDLDNPTLGEPAKKPALKVEFETELKYKHDVEAQAEPESEPEPEPETESVQPEAYMSDEGDMKEIVPEADETPEDAADGDMKVVEEEQELEEEPEQEPEEEPEQELEEKPEQELEEKPEQEPEEEPEQETEEESEQETEQESEQESEPKPAVFTAPMKPAEPEKPDEQEVEMTLDDFDEDDITLAPEVLAEIDGIGPDDYEAPPVNISGIEPERIPMETKRDELESFEEEWEQKHLEKEQPKDEQPKTEQPKAEKPVHADLAVHEFGALKTAEIQNDGYLEQFLKKQNADLETYFGFFAYQSDTRAQLIKALEILLNPQIKNINLVISGERDSGVNNITRGVAKVLHQGGFLKSGKIAFTDADKINSMKLTQKTDKLEGCCLAIASAGSLNSEAVDELIEADKAFAGKTAVVLTDYRSEINRMLRDYRELNGIYPQRIHVPAFDAEDLADLAFVRFDKEGYSIEKPACELMMKELRSIARANGGVLNEAEKYIGMIVDVVETRKALVLMSGNFEMTDADEQNVITVKDVESVKR